MFLTSRSCKRQIIVKTKNHSKKRKKLKLKKRKDQKKKRRKKPTPTPTPSRTFTDTLFFLGCSENEECRVRRESQTDKKNNNKINKYNSKEIKTSLSEKQKTLFNNGTQASHS